MQCPQCQANTAQIKDGSTNAGSQRYRCKACGCRYTPHPIDRSRDEDIRLQALNLHYEGMSLRDIAEVFNVHHQTVANWIHVYEDQLPDDLPESILDLAVLDGTYVPPYIRKKKQK